MTEKWMPKPGDRVRCYGASLDNLWVSYSDTDPRFYYDGVINSLLPKGFLEVALDSTRKGLFFRFHSKQCRRLTKKERRRIWVPVHFLPEPHGSKHEVSIYAFSPCNQMTTEFVEVLKK